MWSLLLFKFLLLEHWSTFPSDVRRAGLLVNPGYATDEGRSQDKTSTYLGQKGAGRTLSNIYECSS